MRDHRWLCSGSDAEVGRRRLRGRRALDFWHVTLHFAELSMPEPPPPSRPVDFEQPRLDCQPREPLRPQAAGESRLTWRRKRSAGILRQVAKAAGVDRKAEEVVGGLTARVEAGPR
jgi:hypothetical protein